eukprot:TRINITY_DN29566_c0_g1_i1.p1 TRINITY_DN29566_c0_g1~~TRINITY_DN29566_c0_g1_i1.p1  ORF type:complete len:577 (+),score=141.75 TRINITY_DN29566_c0_g1_i1:57-1733(+)
MSCWREVCRAYRSRSQGALETAMTEAEEQHSLVQGEAKPQQAVEPTFSAPAPSPSYQIAEELAKSRPKQRDTRIPEEMKTVLKDFRNDFVKLDEELSRKQKVPKAGPTEPDSLYAITLVEAGEGHRKPKQGSKVKISCMVVLKESAEVIAFEQEVELTLGNDREGHDKISSHMLEGMLVQMKRRTVASITHPLSTLFPANAPQISDFGPDAMAVCELQLHEIYVERDCSFTKDAGEVMKETIKEGVGAWCDNPTDEGMAVLRIEEVFTSSARLFPEPGDGPLELCAAVGDGEVCDALECAMLDMRQHETALVTCKDSSFFVGGKPLGDKIKPPSGEIVTMRVTLLDYNKGPDAGSFEEEDRLVFALRRKAEANRLFAEGRYRLARHRYQKIIELFHHLDRAKTKERFYGKPELFSECRKLRIDCRLNIAACSIKLQDPSVAKEACNLVLQQMPENTKAFYRRAQSHIQQKDYLQACLDLQRLLDIDPTIEEARRLLEKSRKQRGQADKQQSAKVRYGTMVKTINDDRSDKWTYLNAPVDSPDMEGLPVSALAQANKRH